MTTLTFTRPQFASDATARRHWNFAFVVYLNVKNYHSVFTVAVDGHGVISMGYAGELTQEQKDDLLTQMRTLQSVKVVKPGFSGSAKYEFIYSK